MRRALCPRLRGANGPVCICNQQMRARTRNTKPLKRESFGISFSLAARELLGTPHITSRTQDIYRLDPGHFRTQRETLLDLYENAITRNPQLARQELNLIEKEFVHEKAVHTRTSH